MNQHKKCTWRATQLRHQRRGMVAIDWVQKCIKDNEFDNEELFEVLDFDGENGPRQSRKNGSDNKLFETVHFGQSAFSFRPKIYPFRPNR